MASRRARRRQRRSIPLRQGIAVIALGAIVVVAVLLVLQSFDPGQTRKIAVAKTGAHATSASSHGRSGLLPPRASAKKARKRVGIGEVKAVFTDRARTMVVLGRRVPRAVEAIIRYPVGLSGPFPLIVFGHGFAVNPTPYSLLLDAWTRAGYVVAAPIFPLENANAPGGPDERDLVNQPRDMSLVISSLRGQGTGQVARIGRMIDSSHIAVAGQSDGGDTALAATYGTARDRRIGAAVILSGAEDPFAPVFAMPPNGPPLLAVQGTADTINPPYQTYSFYQQAAPPKYLLKLIGAGHQAPYTEPGSDLTMVERMTLAFLNEYLKGRSQGLRRYLAAGSAGPGSALSYVR